MISCLTRKFAMLCVAGILIAFISSPANARGKNEGTIQGLVIGRAGREVGGARVHIWRESGRHASKFMRTGPHGRFESSHEAGTFGIYVRKRGVGHSSTMHVFLKAGQTVSLPRIYIFPHRHVLHFHRHILGVGRPREARVTHAITGQTTPIEPPVVAEPPPVVKRPLGAVRGK